MKQGTVSANRESRSPGIAVPGLSSGAGRAFRLPQLHKQEMLDVPRLPSLCTQTPAGHGRDACWKKMPGDL